MTPGRRRSTLLRAACAVACAGLVIVPAVRAAGGPPAPRQATPTGGTAYWAEIPGDAPTWIFPFASLDFATTYNQEQFQQLMYRPLYWLADKGTIGLDATDSLAAPPVYSHGGRVVTIDLKGWKWSNGTVVDAQDVVFFLNMLRAEKTNWYGYVAGEMPDNVVSVAAPDAGALAVTITFAKAYNSRWILENELSQITPMPIAWDISKLVGGKPAAPGSGGCSSMTWDTLTQQRCQAVWSFMTDDNGTSPVPKEAGDVSTYATNPLWQVVDGPWRLEALSPTGRVTMVPNVDYSGTDKPALAKFVEVPYGSYFAEEEAVFDDDVSVAYLPDGTTQSSSYGVDYDIAPSYSWDVNYIVLNFDSNGDHDRARYLFRQLYIRQALQELVDQPAIVKDVFNGDAVADDGPVPPRPATNLLSTGELHDPYPYDPSKAIALLKAHGWTIDAGGTSICTATKGCGPLIPEGTKLALRIDFASAVEDSEIVYSEDITDWSKAGIHVTAAPMSYTETVETATPCRATQPACSWEMAFWGGGWLYQPDLYPTGDFLFETGSGYNSGSYSNAENDTLVAETLASNDAADFLTWENYITKKLPVVWQPESATVMAVAKDLRGVTPFSPLLTLDPEDWSFRN